MQSDLDSYKEDILHDLSIGVTKADLARSYGTSRKSINRALKRWAISSVDQPVIDTTDTRLVTDPESLMKELGINPDEWQVRDVLVSRWGKAEDPNYQLKAKLSKNIELDLIRPAEHSDPLIKARIFSEPDPGQPKLVVACGDQHAPFHDQNLHRLFLDWLSYNSPHEGIILGDLCDFPELSRHRHKPEWKADTQDCINSGYEILNDYISSSHGTKWRFIPGNHDERIRNSIIDYNRQLFNLQRAYVEGQSEPEGSVWSLPNLLRMERLGIEYTEPGGSYSNAQCIISPKIAARHGWIARPKSGATAHSTLDVLGHSIIVGHTHRRGLVYATKHEIGGDTRDLVAIEAGCMCRVDKPTGLGYAIAPDWQNGFVTITVWPDGSFHAEPAVYVNNRLLWRDQVYT